MDGLDSDWVELLRHDKAAAEFLMSTSLPKLGGPALGDVMVLDNNGVGMRVSRRRKSRTLHIIVTYVRLKFQRCAQTFGTALDLPSRFPFCTYLRAENKNKDQFLGSIPRKTYIMYEFPAFWRHMGEYLGFLVRIHKPGKVNKNKEFKKRNILRKSLLHHSQELGVSFCEGNQLLMI